MKIMFPNFSVKISLFPPETSWDFFLFAAWLRLVVWLWFLGHPYFECIYLVTYHSEKQNLCSKKVSFKLFKNVATIIVFFMSLHSFFMKSCVGNQLILWPSFFDLGAHCPLAQPTLVIFKSGTYEMV